MFYGDSSFPHGLSRSGHFNKRESQELEQFGHTLLALSTGALTPENEEEQQFVDALNSNAESSLYAVKLWRKYLDAINKSKVRHGFAQSNAKSQQVEDFSPEVSEAL